MILCVYIYIKRDGRENQRVVGVVDTAALFNRTHHGPSLNHHQHHQTKQQCAVERRTGKVQMTLVWNAPGRKEAGAELSRLLKALKAADPDNVRFIIGDIWR